MNNIALLIGDTVIYWNNIIFILGLIAGGILIFALRPYKDIKIKALILWFVTAFDLSFLFSRMFYFYCYHEKFVNMGEALTGFFDRYNVMGMIIGTVLAALIVKCLNFTENFGDMLDTVFPGVILAVAVIRLGYLFTETFHSTITVSGIIWKRLPFAVSTTDAAGNTSYVFAPFFISFIVLLVMVFVTVLFVRSRIRRPGDLFYLVFTIFALSEIVLESTRYDSLKVHFIFLDFLNPYVGFISFSMFVCGICLIIVLILQCREAAGTVGRKNAAIPAAAFAGGFICFGIFEYLVQRYTTLTVLFHWLQTVAALVMAGSIILLIYYKNRDEENTEPVIKGIINRVKGIIEKIHNRIAD